MSGTYEEARVDCRTALGGIASGSTSRYVDGPTTVGRSKRSVSTDPSPNDRRFLHRGNDRDVLQRTHRPEHGWLRIARRYGIEQRYRIEQRVCIEQRVWIERWCGWRWHHRIVDSALLGVSAT